MPLVQKKRISLRKVDVGNGLELDGAPDLIARRVDSDGAIWATRGFDVYVKSPESKFFSHRFRLPVPPNYAALFMYASVRTYFRQFDIAQPYWLQSGTVLANSGGWLWRRETRSNRFRKAFRLRYWGRGIGRGIFHNGLVQLKSGRILFGEYFRNDERKPVRIYGSSDDGITWDTVYEFESGAIRHIHSLVEDPYTSAVWACTGDHDHESCLARSSDEGHSFETVGSGSQAWRACSLLFVDDYIYWGADTSKFVDYRNIYRMHRDGSELQLLQPVDGPVEFGARIGKEALVFSTSRIGYEEDPSPRIWIGKPDGRWRSIIFGKWSKALHKTAGKIYLCPNPLNDQICVSLVNVLPHDRILLIGDWHKIVSACE